MSCLIEILHQTGENVAAAARSSQWSVLKTGKESLLSSRRINDSDLKAITSEMVTAGSHKLRELIAPLARGDTTTLS